MTLQSRIATATMSREISQIVDCDGTKAEMRFNVNIEVPPAAHLIANLRRLTAPPTAGP